MTTQKLDTKNLNVRYPVLDRVLPEDLLSLGLRSTQVKQPLATLDHPARGVQAQCTGEKRPPKKGEWYLSGAVVGAYRASNNLSTWYHIAKLVRADTAAKTTPALDLDAMYYFLDIARDVVAGKSKRLASPYSPAGSERKVCLLWAAWMCSRPPHADGTPTRPCMDALRDALYEVRQNEAMVDLKARKVFCKEAGRVLDFSRTNMKAREQMSPTKTPKADAQVEDLKIVIAEANARIESASEKLKRANQTATAPFLGGDQPCRLEQDDPCDVRHELTRELSIQRYNLAQYAAELRLLDSERGRVAFERHCAAAAETVVLIERQEAARLRAKEVSPSVLVAQWGDSQIEK